MRISVNESPRNIVIKDAALPEIGDHDGKGPTSLYNRIKESS